jgi:glycosyltransferase involved in cell wall biosynthesis
MNDSSPLITIGITCFNAEASVRRAVESALAQSWTHKEIIVVDDCSTDSSLETLKDLKGIKVIRHEQNIGPGGARQTLVNEAQGEFIAFFDDDDESLPHRLNAQYDVIRKAEIAHGHSKIACYCSGMKLYPNGYKVPIDAIGRKPIEPYGEGMADRILFFASENEDWCYGGTPTCSLMVSTKEIKSVGGFDSAFRRVEDLDFAVRFALAGGVFTGTAQRLFKQHATLGHDKTHRKNLMSEIQLIEKHKDYLQSKNRYYHARYWPELRCAHFEKKYDKFISVLCGLIIHHPVLTFSQLLKSGPKRIIHEYKMGKKR